MFFVQQRLALKLNDMAEVKFLLKCHQLVGVSA